MIYAGASFLSSVVVGTTCSGMTLPPDFSARAIGARLSKARVRKGLSQDEVTAELGLGTRVLAAWEQGTRFPSDEALVNLARTYGTHPAILRYGDSVLRDAALTEASNELARAAAELQALAEQMAPAKVQMDADDAEALEAARLRTAGARRRPPKKNQGGSSG